MKNKRRLLSPKARSRAMETPNEMENSCVGQHETVLTVYIAGTRDVTLHCNAETDVTCA
jgi:hypothetical protein